jgi:biopolymer transport protein ExbD
MAKVKKSRVGFVIDMTPLVDITFLLLTFFMFTAKFKSEADSAQKFQIKRPVTHADTTKIPDRNISTIKIAIGESGDTSYHFAVKDFDDRKEIWSRCVGELIPQDSLFTSGGGPKPQIDLGKNIKALEKAIEETKLVRNDMEFAIDADKRLTFEWVWNAMEKLRINRATRFNYVTDKLGG